MKFGTVCATLCILAIGTGGQALDLQTFGSDSKTARAEGVELKARQQATYREFRKRGNYFGVYYVNTSVDEGFYVTGFHNLAKAHAAARKGCQEASQNAGQCVFYAATLPKSLPLTTTSASGLGQESLAAYQGRFQSPPKPGHRAFAISGAWNYGVSYGWENAAEARATALAYCEAGVAAALAQLNIEGRRWARANGLTRCRIVDHASL